MQAHNQSVELPLARRIPPAAAAQPPQDQEVQRRGLSADRLQERPAAAPVPLPSLRPGERGSIAYLRAGDGKKVQKLMAMGVLPGNTIQLQATFPSVVFSVDYSQYAVDADMAAAIIVTRESARN